MLRFSSTFFHINQSKTLQICRHAKYGRPGVKTEYNESYRSWTEAKSKWDYFAVSAYSQKELDRMAKIEKKPPAGWPCRQFNVSGRPDVVGLLRRASVIVP